MVDHSDLCRRLSALCGRRHVLYRKIRRRAGKRDIISQIRAKDRSPYGNGQIFDGNRKRAYRLRRRAFPIIAFLPDVRRLRGPRSGRKESSPKIRRQRKLRPLPIRPGRSTRKGGGFFCARSTRRSRRSKRKNKGRRRRRRACRRAHEKERADVSPFHSRIACRQRRRLSVDSRSICKTYLSSLHDKNDRQRAFVPLSVKKTSLPGGFLRCYAVVLQTRGHCGACACGQNDHKENDIKYE